MVIDITQRAGAFLEIAHPGAHKNKRIAQRHGISPDMAKVLRRGEGWTAARIGEAASIYGRAFVDYVFQNAPRHVVPLVAAPTAADLADLKAEIQKTQQEIAHVAARLDPRPMAAMASDGAEPARGSAERAGEGLAGSGGRDLARTTTG
jgi:hypothetical protein